MGRPQNSSIWARGSSLPQMTQTAVDSAVFGITVFLPPAWLWSVPGRCAWLVPVTSYSTEPSSSTFRAYCVRYLISTINSVRRSPGKFVQVRAIW